MALNNQLKHCFSLQNDSFTAKLLTQSLSQVFSLTQDKTLKLFSEKCL